MSYFCRRMAGTKMEERITEMTNEPLVEITFTNVEYDKSITEIVLKITLDNAIKAGMNLSKLNGCDYYCKLPKTTLEHGFISNRKDIEDYIKNKDKSTAAYDALQSMF